MNEENSSPQSSVILCRFCFDDSEEPVISPCYCKGTIGLVHISCLEHWLSESRRDTCELCNYKFATKIAVRYSLRKSLILWIMMKDSTRGHHVRGFWGDVGVGLCMSAITLGALYFSVLAADYYTKNEISNLLQARFTTFMLFLMVGIITLGYYLWLYSAIKYHTRAWYNWWQSQVVVKLSEHQKSVQSDLDINLTIGEDILQIHTDEISNTHSASNENERHLRPETDSENDSMFEDIQLETDSGNDSIMSEDMPYTFISNILFELAKTIEDKHQNAEMKNSRNLN